MQRLPTLAAATSPAFAGIAPVVVIIIATTAAIAPIFLVVATLPPSPTPTPLVLELHARPVPLLDGSFSISPGGCQVATQVLQLFAVPRRHLCAGTRPSPAWRSIRVAIKNPARYLIDDLAQGGARLEVVFYDVLHGTAHLWV